MSSISFDNAWLLLIAVPLVILLAVPFFIAVRKDNRNGHNIASCALHIAMAVLIAFAAAGVTVETTLTETDVYVVADVSYSANRNLTKVDSYIEDLQDNLPRNSEMGVIVFGKDCEVITKMGGKFSTVKNYTVDDSQTDIANALTYAGKIFKSNVIKRVVLITDAKQTGASGDDEFKQAVDDLLAKDIYIDAIYLDDNLTDDQAEVQVTGVTCSQTAYKGQASQAAVSVRSTQKTAATMSLYSVEDGEETFVSSQSISLSAGTTSVYFDLSGERAAGTYSYAVYAETSSSSADSNPYDNCYTFTQTVEDNVKVLFITGVQTDADNAKSIFSGMNADLDVYCNVTSVPYTVADVCEYDIIALSNVDVSTLNNYSMFIDSLGTAVSQLGKSLIGIGNLYLQNTEDEAMQKLQDMLPVSYGGAERDTKQYTLVIDCSFSMNNTSKLIRAKEAATSIVKLLDESDRLNIIQTYSDSSLIYSNLVGDGQDAIAAIENIEAMQGTVLSGGLNMAYDNISSSVSSSSVIMITDGASSDVQACYDAAEKLYTDKRVLTSVLNVDDYENNESFLRYLSEGYGHGKYFLYTSNSNNLQEIIDTIADELGETMVDGTAPYDVNVNYKNYTDSVLDGVKDAGLVNSSNALGYIYGFMVTTAKTGATTVLNTSFKSSGATSSTTVPVYSYWSYGNGSSAAFTSSISGDWVTNWYSSNILQTFFADVLTTNIPSERIDTPYTVSVDKGADSFSIEVVPVEVKSGAKLTVTVTGPDGESYALTNVVFDSSVYTCSFSFDSTGTYKITIDYQYSGVTYNSYDYYAGVAYLAEYDSFTNYDASLLYKLIGANGTVSEDGSLVIENGEDVSTRTVSLTIPILVIAAVLLVADIIIRKLKWSDIVSLFKKVDKADGGRKV